MTRQPSVQLYSVRDTVQSDLPGAIARLAEIGFTQVEPYAFHTRTAEFKDAFAAAGVTAPSGHAAVIDAEDPRGIFEAANTLGITTVIDPFVPSERWQTADDVARLAQRVNELSELAHEYVVTFGYHNHAWELENTVGGRPVLELFADQLAPEVVLEIDTFWATVGGADTPALLEALGERVQFIHVKDGAKSTDTSTQQPAGQGEIDVPAILAAAPQALRVVEFDAYAGDVFEGIAASLAWLKENDQ
ncbi:sugar phosphate isomerase/epimerase family protein [Kineococcus sp. SYSU DK003]|uniref:sugar phosphate isomerase/epimerase family protein n=1 Tax=Kineococcus sp. SYSU DK003 TaxID=3383124 RepID=UPI003D7D8B6F